MKRILFCITRLNGGGAERALSNLTLAMPMDVQVDILVNCEEFDKDYAHKGNVISIASVSKNKIRIPFPIKVLFGRYYKLNKLKRTGNYDACISFMDNSNIANILTGSKFCKVIISERTTLSQIKCKEYKYKIRPLAKMLYKKADKIVAVSRGVADDLNINFNVPINKLITIYNGYDINYIYDKSNEQLDLKFDSSFFIFLNIGRLDESKGQWHLIRAFAAVQEMHPESRLIICGQGPYIDLLQKIVNDYNLQEKVFFLGFVKNPYAISRASDAFVFPSMYEGMPNAMIENMVCGLPIIASDFRSGAREILAPNTDYKYQVKDNIEMAEYGIILPVCSGRKRLDSKELEKEEELLSEAMIKIIESKELRTHYKEQSLKRAQDFLIDKKVVQWLELME